MRLPVQGVLLCVFSCVALLMPTFFVQAASIKKLPVSEENRAWLNTHISDIYFAPEKDYPPMIWSDYGVLFGISYDYLKLLEQQLGVQFMQRDPRPLSQILSATQGGEQNIISSLSATPERSEYLVFTRPYLEAPALFFTKSGKQNYNAREIEDKKLKVGVGDGYGVHEYLRNRYADMVLVPFENDYRVLEAVSSGVVDVGAIDVFSLSYLVKEESFMGIKVMGETGFKYQLSFAVPISMTPLRDMLDDAIEALPEKTIYELNKRWIPQEVSAVYSGANSSPSDPTLLALLFLFIGICIALVVVAIGFAARHMLVRQSPLYQELEEKAAQRIR